MTEFTPARLAELRAVAEAATPGPWEWEQSSADPSPSGDEPLVTSNPGEDGYPDVVLSGWGYDESGTEASDEDRAHIATFDPPTVLALIAALESKTAEADYWRNSWNREDGYRVDAERERDKALAEVERITESRNEWASRMMELASETQRADRAEAAREELQGVLERVRAVRAFAPECDKYDDDSPVVCGWKRTVQRIDAALEATEGAEQ